MSRQPFLDPRTTCVHATDPTRRPHCQLTAAIRYGTTALCSDCNSRRSTLGKGDTPQPLPPAPLPDLLHWITTADRQLRAANAELTAAVQRARAHGHSWTTIGAALDITKQAAHQRFGQPPAHRQA